MSTVPEASGRRRHTTKITIYMDDDELLRLDGTILELRRLYGIKIDRGRYVREALAGASLVRIAQRLRTRRDGAA